MALPAVSRSGVHSVRSLPGTTPRVRVAVDAVIRGKSAMRTHDLVGQLDCDTGCGAEFLKLLEFCLHSLMSIRDCLQAGRRLCVLLKPGRVLGDDDCIKPDIPVA